MTVLSTSPAGSGEISISLTTSVAGSTTMVVVGALAL